MPTVHDDVIGLAWCAFAIVGGLALLAAGIILDPVRSLRRK